MVDFDPVKKICEASTKRNSLPSTSSSIATIVDAINAGTMIAENLNKLADVISNDFTVTQKIIKLANSKMYATYSSGRVSNLHDALQILGTDVIGYLALSTKILDEKEDEHSAGAKELNKTMVAASIAKKLSDGEWKIAAQALLFNTGKLLCAFYLKDEFAEAEKLIAGGLSEEDAAIAILGKTFEEIGAGVAETWNFPPELIQAAARKETDELKLIKFAVDASSLILAGKQQELEQLVEKSAAVINRPVDFLTQKLAETKSEYVFTNKLPETSSSRKLLINLIVMIRERLKIDRVILFIKNKEETEYQADLVGGMGPYADRRSQIFFSTTFEPTVFHLALVKNSDIFISNTKKKETQVGIPAWHKNMFSDAEEFMIMPIAGVGCVYCDWKYVTNFKHETLEELKKFRDGIAELLKLTE